VPAEVGLKIGICGVGMFAPSFIPLFKAHPGVAEVVVTDIRPERAENAARRFGVRRIGASLEDLLESDVDAVAIFTQRHLHGEQTVQALKAGKHVYCAVPIGHSLETIREIIELVLEKRLIYMTGETSYYYPATIYCRERHKKGDFGHIFYAEAQYIHDMSHGFYEAFQHSGGEAWKQVAGIPPMWYPTHSVSMVLSVTGARATHVSCLGWRDRHPDGIFREGANLWDNPFSNESALMRTSDGAIMRINEFRRVGWSGINSVHMSLFGTEAVFEEQANGQVWTERTSRELIDLTELLSCSPTPTPEEAAGLHEELKRDFYTGVSKVHPVHRLPDTFKGLPNGHFGSHQFLVDDFVKAVHKNQLPPNHVWAAARYCIPGLIAHQSALREGELMEIPDLGDPPADWPLLDPEEPL
jgi:Predicted dehydrogenases and related proteins